MTTDVFTIKTFGGNCPVQAEGTIDGHPFYFRARGEAWSMSIGGADVIGKPLWHHCEYWAPWPDAGWMNDDDARACIDKSIAIFRLFAPAWVTTNPAPDAERPEAPTLPDSRLPTD